MTDVRGVWYMKYMKKIALFFIISSIVFITPSARAQNIPPGQEPAAQAARFQAESERKARELEKKKGKAPDVEIEEEKEAPPVEKEMRFVLKEVKVTGAKKFEASFFLPAYQSYLYKEVTFKDLSDIADRIKAEYKRKGYLTTVVFIPEQNIVDGVVEIRVAEGEFGKLKIEGNKYFGSNLIKKYIHSKKNEILDLYVLQKDILRLNQNPDLQVKTVVSAGEEPDTSDVTMKVDDKFPFHAGASFDNQGTRLTGKDRTSVSVRHTNLTGHNDSVFANIQFTRSSSGEFVSYLLPADTLGSIIGLNFTYFEMKLGEEFKSFDITGKTLIFTPHVSRELYLSEDIQANVDIGLDIKSITKKTGTQTTADDQLRLPYLDFDFSETDGFGGGGQTSFSPKFIFGTSGFLGASKRGHPTTSRSGTGGAFFVYEHSISRVQRMPFESYMSIRSQFQAGSTSLPSSEQFQLGGANSVRGYPEGDYVADWGANLTFDWVFPMYLIPKEYKLPRSETPLRNQIQPVAFMDLGGGGLKKPLTGESKEKFLMGLGGGLKISLYNKLSARLEWAKDVGDKPTSGSGASTFYVTIQGEI